MAKNCFAIDFGATNARIAYIDDKSKKPLIIGNMDGYEATPCVVYFEEDDRAIVGEAAKENAVLEPVRVCDRIRSKMGKEKAAIYVNGQEYSPEMLFSLILKKMVSDAEILSEKKVKDVVITCPDSSQAAEIQAIKDAGRMAGLNVLGVIRESAAALMARNNLKEKENKQILVYNLGGGDFSVSVLRVTGNEILYVCSEEDVQLGGREWDLALNRYLINEFCKSIDADSDPFDLQDLQELMMKAEKVKCQLSAKDKTKVVISAGGYRKCLEVTRETFEMLTEVYLNRTLDLTKRAIEQARKNGAAVIDEVILTGGSCHMPQIRQAIEREFADIECMTLFPDAVIYGAAYYAELLQEKGRTPFITDGPKPGGDRPFANKRSIVLKLEGFYPDGRRMTLSENLIFSTQQEMCVCLKNFYFGVNKLCLSCISIDDRGLENNLKGLERTVCELNYHIDVKRENCDMTLTMKAGTVDFRLSYDKISELGPIRIYTENSFEVSSGIKG